MENMRIRTESKEYPLYIGRGIRHQFHNLVDSLQKKISSFLIISDESVASLYLDDITATMDKDNVFTHTIPSGEEAKSMEHFFNCQTKALESGLDRHSCIVALGGGVVGDLAGFVAATYMRGISFIQVPTTLLAHDSSVGGKVAINHPLGKNMIGAFYQPDAVIYDVETLHSLNDTEWRSGFAEVIKHGLIWDKSLYHDISTSIHSLAELKKSDLISILKRAIAVKAEIVAQDETEKGVRSYLNFGHTLGHAIEAELGYGKMSHGEAVAIGMVFAMKLSEQYYGNQLHVDQFTNWLASLGFSTHIPSGLSAEKLLETMKKDKKAQFGQIHMVLLKQIGEVESVPIDEETLYAFLKEETKGGKM
ncbi:3-dehydroquinate synthase [Pueribacillus theae]|uniref:3-dehydroquinate synthase n=1 Tax=Pueribacillus theae TaxID=2171751 RepID=A0A2U1K4L3_9BACI|nr:3-dehydroquinate synthase [Pueribacillus theae]PWA12436.1 3-dehydroquinate synthase [Pueribacillus theae]